MKIRLEPHELNMLETKVHKDCRNTDPRLRCAFSQLTEKNEFQQSCNGGNWIRNAYHDNLSFLFHIIGLLEHGHLWMSCSAESEKCAFAGKEKE
jgi:hypothetical protein